jgi:hypothetical protein
MSELEEKLNTLMSNPQLMQQIMSMAESMKQSPNPPEPNTSQNSSPDLDMDLIRQLSGMAQTGTIDRNQQGLLKALAPYLSQSRISKLEKAMRAAKMAQFATLLLNSGHFQSGR